MLDGRAYLASKQRGRTNLPYEKVNLNAADVIIQLQNTNAADLRNVTIYNSLQQRTNDHSSTGNYGIPLGVIPSCLSGNGVTYANAIANSEAKPMKIGLMCLLSNSGLGSPHPQCLTTVTIKNRSDNGAMLDQQIVQDYDVFAAQLDRSFINYTFNLDGYAAITFDTLKAGATLGIYLFMERRFNQTRTLGRIG